MIVKLLLDRKREGEALSGEEIRELVSAYARGEVPDYQMAAFAMGVCCRGMTDAETGALTAAMRDSGACLTWDDLNRPTADKHSTGGVGDKLSLVVQPLAAACGLGVPSLVGRGLGLTGGTADKMEAIPGYRADLTLSDFRRTVAACGCSLTVQTAEIAPADKKLYALRDVTGTVPSIPLIVASILSKKLAEGAETLVFDVKCGSGAFMKTVPEASALARALVAGAKEAGRRAAALVTDMDEPLGRAVGNALEVEEACAVLRGARDVPDVRALSVELAARMVALAKACPLDEARALCEARLADGSAWTCFERMVTRHGGDLSLFETRNAAFRAAHPPRTVTAAADGYVTRIDADGVAQAAFRLGAGRTETQDAIDPSAGVRLLVSRGEPVTSGQPVAELYAQAPAERLEEASKLTARAIEIGPEKPAAKRMIREVVE